MGIATRFYLFLDDGSIRRVPQRIAYEMPFGRDAIPEFADTRQRALDVLVESDNGRPARILDARGSYWTFDTEGRISDDLITLVGERMKAHDAVQRAKRTKVTDLRPEIKLRELRAKHEWTPTAEDLDRITADLWPGVHGPAPEITSVEGAKPKKPPLTHAGRWALDRIEKHVEAITLELGGLSERALKGLAFEAQRMSTLEDEAIWRGIADEAKRWEAIRAAERTGKGEWYAVIEVSREDRDNPRVMEEVAVAHVKGASRKEAIEAGRKLMAEKVAWLDAGTFVEVTLRSALEWEPEERE